MKLKIIILLFTFIFSSVLADEMQSMQLFKDINHSFSESNIHIDLKSVSVEDIEQNATIMSEVDVYLKLLPSYLEQTPVFTKELYRTNEYIGPERDYVSGYLGMFTVSLIHMKILMAQNNYDDVSLVLQAHLHNASSLMEYTNSFTDYILAIVIYQKIYDLVSDKPQYCTVFKDNPVPSFEEFFRIRKVEKSALFEMYRKSLMENEDVEFQSPIDRQLKEYSWKRMKYYYNQYDACYLNASKSDSPILEIKRCDEYVAEQNKIHSSFLAELDFLYESTKVELQSRFWFNVDITGMGDYIGKALALIPYSKLESIAQEHKKTLAQYQKLVAECKGFEKTE